MIQLQAGEIKEKLELMRSNKNSQTEIHKDKQEYTAVLIATAEICRGIWRPSLGLHECLAQDLERERQQI